MKQIKQINLKKNFVYLLKYLSYENKTEHNSLFLTIWPDVENYARRETPIIKKKKTN